jgi:hypothetical protein
MDPTEVELQASALDVIRSLARGDGLDLAAAERLKQALHLAEQAWSNSTTISKSAANLFVDLAWGIDSQSYAYRGDEAERIRTFAQEVADLVRVCVAI